MLSHIPIVSLSFVALLSAGFASALELQLPPPGEGIVGQVQMIKAKYKDTFAGLNEQYNLGYSEMVATNPGVDPRLPGVGTRVIIPTYFVLPPGPREGVVINLVEYRLYRYPEGQNMMHAYLLGISREDWGSPIANIRITAKTEDPAWHPSTSIRAEHTTDGDPLPTVMLPDPGNPLGPCKLALGVPGYLIHGSSKKFGIGTRTSHGCSRMYNADMTHLFSMISVGTSARIVSEPYKFGASNGKVYLEAHTPLDDHDDPPMVDKHTAVINILLKRDGLAERIQLSWDVVREVVASEDGVPVGIAQESAPAMTATVDNDPTQLTP